MPCSMIHLITAKKIRLEGGILFFIGNLAPDAVIDGRDKEAVHFRDVKNRQSALITLAKETNGDFGEGVLLHLFLDWKWDETIRQTFINKTDGDWFVPYRNELSRAGSYAFHNTSWAKQLWIDMDAFAVENGIEPYASAADVHNFVSRNNKWHNDNVTEASPAFPPDLIDDFTSRVVTEFADWKININLR